MGFGPGKVILLGEHGVVYGFPALAGPLTIGVRAAGSFLPAGRESSLVIPREIRGRGRALLAEAFAAAAAEAGLSGRAGARGIRVRLESDLPASMGLGSSAAVSVACARVLLKAAGAGAGSVAVAGESVPAREGRRRRPGVVEARLPHEPAAADVARVAWAMERVFHGTPSGVDHTCAAMGELIHFRRRGDPQKGPRPLVKVVASPRPLKVLVLLVGERPATKETVAALRSRQAAWPERYRRMFREIGMLADDGRRAVEAGELEWLGDLMNMNHGLLAGLGLSSAGIDEAVHRLRAAGALGAKLTGAGGDGGAVIGLFHEPEPVVAKLRRAGLRCFTSQLAGPRAL